MGISFENAYTASPVCCPSRTAVMLGKRPSTTGIYNNGQWWFPHMPDAVSLPMAFKDNGYMVMGAGKIFHHTAGFNPPLQWDEFHRLVFNDDPWFRGKKLNYPWSKFENNPKGYPFSGLEGVPHEGDWGVIPGLKESDCDDYKTVDYVVSKLNKKHQKPFFLACGIFRPHLPWYAPKKYFDLYPLEQIRLPYTPVGDRVDIPIAAFAHNCPVPNYGLDELTLRKATQAYYASVSFIDAQVGRILDALDRLEQSQNTIVVFWSDHGYHLGEHGGVWQKRTLFEQSSRAPMIIAGPGLRGRGQTCRRVVEFVDIYPTLTAVADVAAPESLAGRSLMPLLNEPSLPWDGFAVTQVLRPADERLDKPVMGCSIRTQRWRYTEWAGGEQGVELYDHHADPLEFNNLANDPDEVAKAVMGRLRPMLQSRASAKIPTTPFNPKRL